MIYNFTTVITRIHFAICEVQSDNSNPEMIVNSEKFLAIVVKNMLKWKILIHWILMT